MAVMGPDLVGQPAPDILIMVVIRCISVACAVVAITFTVQAAWIPAKAELANWLLADAFQDSVRDGKMVPPWSWADFRVEGLLTTPTGDEVYVMDRATGQSMAFGAGRHEENRDNRNIVLSAHRDTHFAFLEDVAPGDLLRLHLVDTGGLWRVDGHQLINVEEGPVMLPDTGQLVLVTCWPFDAVDPGTPWRYVVTAQKVE